MLQILHVHCRQRGVEVHFERRVTDLHAFKNDYDIVIGADGVNSVVREAYREHFEPSVQVLSNKYVWYGTEQLAFAQGARRAWVVVRPPRRVVPANHPMACGADRAHSAQ